jgi:hypothetical protein
MSIYFNIIFYFLNSILFLICFPSRLTYNPSFVIVRTVNLNFCLLFEPWAAGKIAKNSEMKKGFRNE